MPLPRKRPAIIGYVEHVDSHVIRGWAWDAVKPDARLCLNVFVGGIFAGCARTGQYRRDLIENGIGDGKHVFVFHVPDFLQGADVTPETIDVFTAMSPPTRLGKIIQNRKISEAEPQSVDLDARAFFRTLIDLLAKAPAADPEMDPGPRRQIETLLAPAVTGPTSAFAEHTHHKFPGSPPSSDGSKFWTWYVEAYGLEQGPKRAPLSAADIAALKELGLSSCHGYLTHYNWAVDEARRLYLEDCLIAPTSKNALQAVPFMERVLAFPLSRFMRTFRSKNGLVARCHGLTSQSRIEIYTLIMLFALTDVHYLDYMPRRWLSAMLEETGGGSLFERTQRTLLGSSTFISSSIFIDRIAVRALGSTLPASSDTNYNEGRIRYGRYVLRETKRFDVQLIGPFRRSLGLSESCRRFAIALQKTGYTINFVDFDTGAQSTASVSDINVGPIGAARINILHLNAEEVPEAIAYLPDCVSRSHVILVPYWELNRPSRVHELGIALVDEIWATTRFIESVFAQSGKRVSYVGMSIDDRAAPPREEGVALLRELGLTVDHFVFLTTSDAHSWAQRKNVLGTIDAFQKAFSSSEVALVVKTRNVHRILSKLQRQTWDTIRERCYADARIILIDEDLSDRDQRALLSACHCLVSLHRAEGLGLDILDALARGMPVVATAYSGNVDFCDADSAWLVDYDLVEVGPRDYAYAECGQVWAEPRIASAVQALQDVFRDRSLRAARVNAARRKVEAQMSPAVFASRISTLIAARLDESKTLI